MLIVRALGQPSRAATVKPIPIRPQRLPARVFGLQRKDLALLDHLDLLDR
jgi:hypothetical protein